MSPHGTHLSVQSAYAALPRATGHRKCDFGRDGQLPVVPDIPSSDSTAPNPPHHTCACTIRPPTTRRAFFPSAASTRHLASNAAARSGLWEGLRLRNINAALNRVELSLPAAAPKVYMGVPSLNTALQRVLSEFVRRSNITLPHFVELMRGQTNDDYRPNKRMIPTVLDHVCEGYRHVDALVKIAKFGARAPMVRQLARQHPYPKNHKSADDRYPVLVKNIRKEQDNWCCLVLDLDILDLWPEVHISPFGVVDKGEADPLTTGRVIHDLSFPDGLSVNNLTDTASICTPEFQHCDAIATEILQQQEVYPDAEILLQAGDVNAAFRNVCTHSTSAYLFGGRLIRDNALIIDTAAAFGWSGSPANYGVVGGAIAYLHGNSASSYRPAGPFNYYWVDDHINVAANVGTNCSDVEQSLRRAMITVLGHGAINEDKITSWSSRQKLLGLVFDSAKSTVAMPESKIHKAKVCVHSALKADSLSRSDYRSLLGRLRHVATCVRPARPFLQRLSQDERNLRRWQRIPVSPDMRQDLLRWSIILESTLLNGVPLRYFQAHPPPEVIVEMDASDSGICTLIAADRLVLRYKFTDEERSLIEATKLNPSVGFDINYRELLSCAFAVHTWGSRWSHGRCNGDAPVQVQFRIDNTSAVSWQNKLSSRNTRAQTVIRLLGHWELEFGLRFSATHVAGVENRIADAGSRTNSSRTMSVLFDELTNDWLQVNPTVDVAGLERIWRTISERALWQHQRSRNTRARSEPGILGRPDAGSTLRC